MSLAMEEPSLVRQDWTAGLKRDRTGAAQRPHHKTKGTIISDSNSNF